MIVRFRAYSSHFPKWTRRNGVSRVCRMLGSLQVKDHLSNEQQLVRKGCWCKANGHINQLPVILVAIDKLI